MTASAVEHQVSGEGETPPSPSATWRTWARIGLQSFGGPAAQIALMHRVLVEERRWLDESQFTRALGFCMLLPGPEAMQLATYAGWRLGGVAGGLSAGLWFVMPGAVVISALAALYVAFGHLPALAAAFLGIKAAVLVLVLQAVVRLSHRALRQTWHRVLAAAAFVALSATALPFPAVVIGAGAIGAMANRSRAPDDGPRPSGGSWRASVTAILAWGVAWFGPLLALRGWLGPDHILVRLGAFFSKLAVVTFGGAYAVLAYMAQDVVVRHGWLNARQMVDALGLAETTPGPLILVNLFVAFVAGTNAHPLQGLGIGFAAAAVALWSTFIPCFLWIFAGAPHVERLASEPRLRGALEGITAAVVGVIASLGFWFAVHVLFAATREGRAGILRWTLPDPATFDLRAVVLAVVCAILLLRLRWSVHRTLAVSALMAWGLFLLQ